MQPSRIQTHTDSPGWSRQLGQAVADHLPVSSLTVIQVPAGKILLPAHQPITRLPLVLTGRLDCVLPRQQGEAISLIPTSFGPGEIAMLSQLFCNVPVWIDVVAGQDSHLRWLEVEQLENLLLSQPDLLLLHTRFLAHRLRDVQLRERSWVERSVHQRVLSHLSRLVQSMPPDADGGHTLHTTHEELAARCGVSRPKLSLELQRLARLGAIHKGRGFVRVVNLGAAQAQ